MSAMAAAGTSIEINGRDRFAPGSETRLLVVESGVADLFVFLGDTERPAGPRLLVASLEAGMVLPFPDLPAAGLRVSLVGVGACRIRSHNASERQDGASVDLVSADGLDAGIAAVLRERAASGGHVRRAYAAEPGECTRMDKGAWVSAHHPLWLGVFPIREDGAAASEPTEFRLVGEGHEYQLTSECHLEALTGQDHVTRFGWDAPDAWMLGVLRRARELLIEQEQERGARSLRRRERDSEQLSGALSTLPAIVAGRGPGAAGAAVPGADLVGEDPVLALAAVCADLKIPFEGSLEPIEHDDPYEVLQDLLRRRNLRFRKVVLKPGWWRQDSQSMVCFDANSGSPVAVLRKRAGRFVRVDPVGGTSRLIDAGEAKALHDVAFTVFKPLPFQPLKGMDLLRHVLSGRGRVDLLWALGLSIAVALLGLVVPILTNVLISQVIPFAEIPSLMHLGLGLAAVAFGTALFSLIRSVALLRFQAFADGTLQAAVWDRLLRLPVRFFRRYEAGDLLIKATAPTELRQLFSDTILTAALSAIFSLVNLALMVFYAPWLALWAAVFTVVTSLIMLILVRVQLRFERQQIQADASVSSFLMQMLWGIQKIRLMGGEDRAFARWVSRFAEQRRLIARADRIGGIISTLEHILPILASVLIFFLVVRAENTIAIGAYAAFAAAFGTFNGAILGLVMAISDALSAVPVYQNMKPILLEQPEIDEERAPAPDLSGRVEVRNLAFRYTEGGPLVLNGIDFSVRPGEFVAFVGPSGSGKSTILRLLLGFETPEQGTVTYDGIDLSRIDPKTLRRQMGVVLQRGTILPGTIYENICGAALVDMDDAWQAARMAGLDEEIEAMPMGMHTVLSDGGGGLSGGQRQRLMIARAVVRKPTILLMDEATSALDNRTQAIVSSSLAHLNATRIVIAHRLSTIKQADCIFVVVDGRIEQRGAYRELMQVEGPFRDLASRQKL